MQVRQISTTTELGTLAEAWGALHQSSEQRNNIFLTYEWLETWWRTMGEPQKLQLYLLVVEEAEGRLIGIAPFVQQEQRWLPGIPIRKLAFMGSDVCDYLDLIICPSREQAVAKAVALYLQKRRQDWDLLELTSLPESSPLLAVLGGAFPHDYLVRKEPYTTCLYICLEGTWDEYLQSRKAKFRQNLRRRRRHFENQLRGQLQVCENAKQLTGALERLFLLSSERQNAKGDVSNLADPSRQSFHREIAPLLLSRGWLDCSYLEIEGEIAAVRYAYRYGQKYYGANHSFDSRWADSGLGSVLYGYSVERAFSKELKEVDLMQGDYSYKYDWASHSRQVHRLQILTPRLRVRLQYMWRESWDKAEGRVRSRVKEHLPERLRTSLKLSLFRFRQLLKRFRGQA